MYINKYLLLCIFCSFFACAQVSSEQEWLAENTSEILGTMAYDFSALKKAIGDKRIVAIGESSHGIGTYYTFKSELVKYLHEEMGFEVLAMEGGLADIEIAFEDLDTLSVSQLRDYSVFGNFRADECTPLFQHIKASSTTSKPLQYTGYDTQYSSNYFFKKIQKLIQPYNHNLSDSLISRMYHYQKSFQAGREGKQTLYETYRDSYRSLNLEVKELLETHHADLLAQGIPQTTMNIMKRSLAMAAASTDLSFEDRYKGIGLRDELMAANLQWLLTEIYPEKKFIIWAHNSHIEKDFSEHGQIEMMGHSLKEEFQDDYYSLGLFAYEGAVYQYWTEQTLPFLNKGTDHIEDRFVQSGKKIGFINLQNTIQNTWNNWIFNTSKGYEPENGGVIPFIPIKRFDGIISFKKTTPPTYNN